MCIEKKCIFAELNLKYKQRIFIMRNLLMTGFVGTDPTIQKTSTGKEFLSFRFANKEAGETDTVWYSVAVFNQSDVEFFKTRIKKGSNLIISGVPRERIYEDKNGNSCIGRDINAFMIQFLNVPSKGVNETQTSNDNESQTTNNNVPQQPINVVDNGIDSFVGSNDDDLPF